MTSQHTNPPLSATDGPEWRQQSFPAVFVPIAPLYLAFGAVLGFAQAGLPAILRAQGLSLQSAGWVYLLYLPIGLSFLWAFIVDRFNVPGMAGRKGWIVSMQGLAAALFLAIGWAQTLSGTAVFAIGLLAASAIATMDIALEALVVETIPAGSRATAAAIKIGTACLGAVVGGGVLLWSYPLLEWFGTFAVLAAFLLVSALPMLVLKGPPTREPAKRAEASVLSALRSKLMRQRIAFLLFASSATGVAFGLNRVALVDLGVGVEQIGLVTGTIAPFAGIAAAALAGAAVARFGRRCVLHILCLPALLSVGGMVVFATDPSTGHMTAILASILGFAVSCAFAVLLGSTIISWSVGKQAGTDFALQYGLSNTAAAFVLFVTSQIAAHAGWPAYFVCVGLVFVAVALVFDPIVDRLGAGGAWS